MISVGITGQSGFIGTHLYNSLGLSDQKYIRVWFDKSVIDDGKLLDDFVQQCDVIVHLAGMNRHQDPKVVFNTNLDLAIKLSSAIKRTRSSPHIIFSSSSQEEKDNPYGRSKKEARIILEKSIKECGGIFTGLIIPNVFGSFGKPYYNSVVATFCHQLIDGETPKIEDDTELNLIYIDELVQEIYKVIEEQTNQPTLQIRHSKTIKVSNILTLLKSFQENYFKYGTFPKINSSFEWNLFITFYSYLDLNKYFPKRYILNTDKRGSFTELIRSDMGSQVSFSITKSGITRGNHFHTRKIERFSIIKGKARIQLRKIGTNDLIEYELDGDQPAYVDIPIWYTHNITNIGEEDLYTVFWINEAYDPTDPDTYIEIV